MLIYGQINVSEGIDFDKSDQSKECMICHNGLSVMVVKIFISFVIN